mgnify:CR=1 FL=1
MHGLALHACRQKRCVCACGKGSPGKLARCAPGIRQQVHAAGLGSRRAAGALCRGQEGERDARGTTVAAHLVPRTEM